MSQWDVHRLLLLMGQIPGRIKWSMARDEALNDFSNVAEWTTAVIERTPEELENDFSAGRVTQEELGKIWREYEAVRKIIYSGGSILTGGQQIKLAHVADGHGPQATSTDPLGLGLKGQAFIKSLLDRGKMRIRGEIIFDPPVVQRMPMDPVAEVLEEIRIQKEYHLSDGDMDNNETLQYFIQDDKNMKQFHLEDLDLQDKKLDLLRELEIM